ncbi:hypothetical protein ACVXZZ_05755 [Staphylococcus aureus]
MGFFYQVPQWAKSMSDEALQYATPIWYVPLELITGLFTFYKHYQLVI